jgi:hypothetical protein
MKAAASLPRYLRVFLRLRESQLTLALGRLKLAGSHGLLTKYRRRAAQETTRPGRTGPRAENT